MTSIPKTCFLCVILYGITLSLSPVQAVAQSSTRSAPQWKSETRQEKEGKPEFKKYELVWKSIDSHQTSILKVWGKDYKFSEKFKDGEKPCFSSLEEQLEPGKYTFSVGFIPNEVAKYQTELSDIVSMRKDLLGKRREMIESGNRDAAKAIYKQTNSLRQEARELQMKWQKIGQNSKHAAIKHQGRFTVHEDRSIEVFDQAKEMEEARATAKEQAETQLAEEFENKN